MTSEEFENWLWEFAYAYDAGRGHYEVLAEALEDFEKSPKTCANCAHSTSKDPKCGMCAGPNAATTRYIKHETHTD